MKIKNFEQIQAWQCAQEQAIFICKNFNELRDFSFRDQIQRAAVSISNNIAEGFDRQTDTEFIRDLVIARGSNSEVKSMFYLTLKLNYISQATCEEGMQISDTT
ncbi:MAG: four helix bundle protein [Saprospiraceae bacterium]